MAAAAASARPPRREPSTEGGARDVQQGEQRQGGGEEDVLGQRDAVGLLRGIPAESLRGGGDQEQDQQGLAAPGPQRGEGADRQQALLARQGAESPAAVELPEGKEVEEVDPGAEAGDGGPQRPAAEHEHQVGDGGGGATPEGTPEPGTGGLPPVGRGVG